MLPIDHPFRDFRNFVFAVWKYLGLPDPTPVQYDIAYYLQHGPKRSIIEAYRGAGKSYLTSAYVAWNWLLNIDCRIMVVSGGQDRADSFSQFCLRLISDMPELRHLKPRRDQRKSLTAFDVDGCRVDHSPSCKSVGITGQLTGSRADIIVADDIETPKNSQTQLQREKLERLVTEFDAVIKPENQSPDSRIIYLGTPQVEDSLYNRLREKGYSCRIWPARVPQDPSRYDGCLAPWIMEQNMQPLEPVDPLRFDDKDLMDRELSYGRSGFALQFMLDTSLSDANKYPLKCSDLILMDLDPEMGPIKVAYGSSPENLAGIDCVGLKGDRWYMPMYVSKEFADYTGSVLAIDPSGRGADKTAYAVVKMLKGQLYCTRLGDLEGGYDQLTLESLARVAKMESVGKIVVESNFGDGMFTELLKPVLQRIYPCTVEEVRHSKQKELRIIDTMEPVLNQHRLVMNKSIVSADMNREREFQLFYQLSRITRERNSLSHDDLLDCLAIAVAYWVDRIGYDQTNAEDDHKREKLKEQIREWHTWVVGGEAPKKPNWNTSGHRP